LSDRFSFQSGTPLAENPIHLQKRIEQKRRSLFGKKSAGQSENGCDKSSAENKNLGGKL
jgi:hypothetical protein